MTRAAQGFALVVGGTLVFVALNFALESLRATPAVARRRR
jgi:hypothetical protein